MKNRAFYPILGFLFFTFFFAPRYSFADCGRPHETPSSPESPAGNSPSTDPSTTEPAGENTVQDQLGKTFDPNPPEPRGDDWFFRKPKERKQAVEDAWIRELFGEEFGGLINRIYAEWRAEKEKKKGTPEERKRKRQHAQESGLAEARKDYDRIQEKYIKANGAVNKAKAEKAKLEKQYIARGKKYGEALRKMKDSKTIDEEIEAKGTVERMERTQRGLDFEWKEVLRKEENKLTRRNEIGEELKKAGKNLDAAWDKYGALEKNYREKAETEKRIAAERALHKKRAYDAEMKPELEPISTKSKETMTQDDIDKGRLRLQ